MCELGHSSVRPPHLQIRARWLNMEKIVTVKDVVHRLTQRLRSILVDIYMCLYICRII